MVGIFKYEAGLKFIAASENFETAVKTIAKQFKTKTYDYLTDIEWWEDGKKYNHGAPRCYEIKEIEFWS